ncbi:MAG: alkaline phosphatase family protein [Bacteroidota bacterium]
MKTSFTSLIISTLLCCCFFVPDAIGQTPQFSHIVIVIGENTDASAVFGNANAPYINNLAATGAKFSNSFAVFHPSQPNYLALYSGSNQGVTGDAFISTFYTTANLGRELIDAQKTYTTYSETMPSVGYNGNTSGKYARKHNPAANWVGTGVNQIPATTNQPFTAFPTDFNTLPSVAMVVPDLCSDGHDLCAPLNNSVKQYDTWVQTNLDAYKQWCKDHNSLLIVTYDEDDNTSVNKIATVFYGAHVVPGVYAQTINHYNVLRLLEDANGLATHAGAAATATPIDFCWESATNVLNYNDAAATAVVSSYPNPFVSSLNVSVTLEEEATVQVEIFDLPGRLIYSAQNDFGGLLGAGVHHFQINSPELSSANGMLVLRVTVNGETKARLVQKIKGE